VQLQAGYALNNQRFINDLVDITLRSALDEANIDAQLESFGIDLEAEGLTETVLGPDVYFDFISGEPFEPGLTIEES
jgi:hypothetical protein